MFYHLAEQQYSQGSNIFKVFLFLPHLDVIDLSH